MPIEYGLPLVQVTDTVVLPVTADETSVVPATEPKFRVATLMLQAAVIVICTVRLAVAVPACAELLCSETNQKSSVPTAQKAPAQIRRFPACRDFNNKFDLGVRSKIVVLP